MAVHSLPRTLALAALLLNLCLATFAPSLLEHSVEGVGQKAPAQLDRRQSVAPLPVTGIQSNGTHPRLEIRELQQNADQWNIYLLGLLRWQQTDQSNLTSYYQISGIHGRPYIPWDGVGPAPGVTSPGYCNHVINTFLTWHRPYLALFEQTLYQNMVEVVNEFPAGSVRTNYMNAISTFRAPYWDWAAIPPSGQTAWPEFMQTPTISVTGPSGAETIHNPLFSYVFHPVNATAFYFQPFASWTNTKRDPTNNNATAKSNNTGVASALDNNRPSIQSRLYNLFINYNNFTEFGDEAWIAGSGVANADSIESVHDLIHALVGLDGDMSYFDYSAFDPAFWLHHAMVDRTFALWQALYPDSYVEPMQAQQQTYTITVGELRTVNSTLEPFYNAAGAFYTSETARSTTTFGYTYPELYPTVDIKNVKTAINNLYGPNATSNGVTRRSSDLELPKNLLPNGASRQYSANIRSPKTALNGTYSIYVFLGGEIPSDSAEWATASNLAGTQAVFAGLNDVDAASAPMANGTSGVLVSGTVPLTQALLGKVEAGLLSSLGDEQVVADYLKENLSWRVATAKCTEVPVPDVPDLQILVVTSELLPASSPDEFPVSTNWTSLEQITRGKAGGLPL